MTDWSKCPGVESIPGKVSGAWVFTGTRLPVSALFENLESGATVEGIPGMVRRGRRVEGQGRIAARGRFPESGNSGGQP